MKSPWPSFAFALLCSACVTQTDAPVKLGDFFFPTACPGSTTVATTQGVALAGGSLDIAGGSAYLSQITIINDLLPPEPPSSPEGNDFVGTQLISAYTAKYTPAGSPTGTALTIPQDIEDLYAVFPAQTGVQGASTTTTTTGALPFLLTPILGQNAYAAFASKLAVGDRIDLTVNLQLSGFLRSGQAEATAPKAAPYPITVFTSGVTCPTGVAATGPCFSPGGQDGTRVICCGTPDAGC